MNFKPGDLVRIFGWNGIVKDIYRSGTSSNVLLEFNFVKNIYKGQKTENHPYSLDMEKTVESSTPEDILSEIERTRLDALNNFKEYLERGKPDEEVGTDGYKAGDIIFHRIHGAGVIKAVFHPDKRPGVALWIYSVKDFFKWHEGRIEAYSPSQLETVLRPASREELLGEIEQKYREALDAFKGVLQNGLADGRE